MIVGDIEKKSKSENDEQRIQNKKKKEMGIMN